MRSFSELTLFLCGDVMTGRGIDQILPNPSAPKIYEPYLKSARDYIELAENVNGAITYPVDFSYIWGEALEEFARAKPDLKIVNLETAITTCQESYPKGINYRMHPQNTGCLTAAKLDCCVLANNHILDWSETGLLETLDVLRSTGMKFAGAGENKKTAATPAVFFFPETAVRVLVFAYGVADSGIPSTWAAAESKPGLNFLPDLSAESLRSVRQDVSAFKKTQDVVVLSIHWGENWGHVISPEERQFAHALIESGVDVIHGHSSHHPKSVEVFREKVILYGCGDFINDYEGISGHERYRVDLSLMYFLKIKLPQKTISHLELVPLQRRKMQLKRAATSDALWLEQVLDKESSALNTRFAVGESNRILWRRYNGPI